MNGQIGFALQIIPAKAAPKIEPNEFMDWQNPMTEFLVSLVACEAIMD